MVNELGIFGPNGVMQVATVYSEFSGTECTVILTFRATSASYGIGMPPKPTRYRTNSKDGGYRFEYRWTAGQDEPQRQMGCGLRSVCGSKDTLHSQQVSGRPTM